MLCIGHRGAKGHAPENTLKSIARGMELGAGWIEVDVYYADSHLVVIHDERLERTTNGKGKLSDKSISYLRSLDAGNGEKIPLLEEVIDLVWKKAGLNIELKGPGTARPVIELLRKKLTPEWGVDKFLVSSFDHKMLHEVRDLDSAIRIGVLLDGTPGDYPWIAEGLNAYSVNQSLRHVNKKFVRDAHNRGFKVFVYTVNAPKDINKMMALGVDGVFTDYPDRLAGLLQEAGTK